MHDLWREQIERVQEGLDPIGIIRGEAADELIPVPGDIRFVSYEEGMRLFAMSLEERTQHRAEALKASAARR